MHSAGPASCAMTHGQEQDCRGNKRTVDGLVLGHRQDLRLPRVGLVAQMGPRGVAGAGGDASVQQRLQQEAARGAQTASGQPTAKTCIRLRRKTSAASPAAHELSQQLQQLGCAQNIHQATPNARHLGQFISCSDHALHRHRSQRHICNCNCCQDCCQASQLGWLQSMKRSRQGQAVTAHLQRVLVADARDGGGDHGGLGEAVELAVGGVPVSGRFLHGAAELGVRVASFTTRWRRHVST